MKTLNHFVIGLFVLIFLLIPAREAEGSMINLFFKLEMDHAGITSLRGISDGIQTEFIAPGRVLGHVFARYRMLGNPWREFNTEIMTDRWTVRQGADGGALQQVVVYDGSGWYDYFADLELTERFRLEEDVLYWTIHFRNLTHKPIEIERLFLPLPFDSIGLGVQSAAPESGSSVQWTRKDGRGRSLVMTAPDHCPYFEPAQTERNFTPAKIESRDENGVSLVSSSSNSSWVDDENKIYQNTKSLILTPKFSPGDEITYVFEFRWVDAPGQVRGIPTAENPSDNHE